MKQVLIARTQLAVSRLSFGTSRLHHLVSRAGRQRLLAGAVELGFSHFDTAPLYGAGLAEEELGRFLRSAARRLTVATKLGLYPPRGSRPGVAWSWARAALSRLWPPLSRPLVDWSLARAEQSLHLSLRRLGRDQVDVLFLHEPDPRLLGSEELLRWLERQRATGKVRHHGLAGESVLLVPWVNAGHPLTEVLQSRDSLVRREADVLEQAGREPQLRFGYLSSRAAGGTAPALAEVVRQALGRVRAGSMLVSSGKLEHLERLCAAASEVPACG